MSRHLIPSVLCGAALAGLTIPASAAPPESAPVASPSNKKVLFIGTDGTRPDLLERAKTPNIHALMATGAYSNKSQTQPPTSSGAGWSSLLTGVWGNKHGVSDNTFKGKNYVQYPDFLTRLEKVNSRFATFAAADYEPLLTTLYGGPLISDSIDTKVCFKGDFARSDRRIADIASNYLAHENVDAAFVYFGNVDIAGHVNGSASPQYTKALEIMDKYVGQLLDAIHSRPTYTQEDWLILISTDHGQRDDGKHGGDLPIETNTFFLANGPSVDPTRLRLHVENVDIAATALAHLGVKTDTSWALDGKVQALKTP